MKILSYTKQGTKYILVLDELKNESDKKQFLCETAGYYDGLEIMFIDVYALPTTIIDVLILLLEKYEKNKFRMITTTYALSNYLSSLNISNNLLFQTKDNILQKLKFNNIEENRPWSDESERLRDDVEILYEDIQDLLTKIFKIYGYDFRNYQKDSIVRITKKIMIKEEIKSFDLFKKKVCTDPKFFRKYFMELSINVTSFFRNPKMFKALRNEILPYLDSFPSIRIWSAGTSSGEEAYSLAILLDELKMLDKCIIYATDFNNDVLQRAQNGVYSYQKLKIAIDNYKQSGGTSEFLDYFNLNNYYLKIKSPLQDKVAFFTHNLITDGVFNEFQLIICKNVFIYFNNSLQKKILNEFNNSLHRNGFLILGKSENIHTNEGDKLFKRYKNHLNIFKKI